MKEYFGKRDCQNCIWHDTSCTKFYCQQITRSQITSVLHIMETCEGVLADDKAGFMEKETAKVVAYEHIAEILKGVQNDTKGS